jgi:hypothetical protein
MQGTDFIAGKLKSSANILAYLQAYPFMAVEFGLAVFMAQGSRLADIVQERA